ncbi:MAG TPA: cupin domain-containing protein [Pyrinomonadaceae bacterium]|nr:cupin domain-containing protein [Pyrinomonadaceae bacterium]
MQSAKSIWTPDESLFERVGGEMIGVARVREALQEAGLDTTSTIITSRDAAVQAMQERLRTRAMPAGFTQHQLPILFFGQNTMHFITYGQPHAKFPEHRHEQDDGLRLIIKGSLIFRGTELTAGDWMYVPRGSSYSFEVGAAGCTIFHAYSPK